MNEWMNNTYTVYDVVVTGKMVLKADVLQVLTIDASSPANIKAKEYLILAIVRRDGQLL